MGRLHLIFLDISMEPVIYFITLIGIEFDLDFDTAVQKAVIGVYDAVSLTTRAPESQRKFGLNLTRSLYNVAMLR